MTYAQRIAFTKRSNLRRANESLSGLLGKIYSKNPLSLVSLVFISVCVGTFMLYIVEATRTSDYSYVINKLEAEQASLEQQFEVLEAEAAKLTSIKRIQENTSYNQRGAAGPSQNNLD